MTCSWLSPIEAVTELPPDIAAWLASLGRIFRAYPGHDSHCTSVALEQSGVRYFVKWSAHPEGMASLRRAIVLGRSLRHPALIPLLHAVDQPDAVLLVYPFVDGEPVYRAHSDQPDPFRALPLSERARTVSAVFDLHVALAELGFIAVDLYDGCVLYDPTTSRPWVYDLDEYRTGPFILEGERNPGSRRLMAPEEFVTGSIIDQVTNVFTLARLALVLMGDRAGTPASWPGTPEALSVLLRACHPERSQRYHTVRAFVAAYEEAMRP